MNHYARRPCNERGYGWYRGNPKLSCDLLHGFPVLSRERSILGQKFRGKMPTHGAALAPPRQEELPIQNHQAIRRSGPQYLLSLQQPTQICSRVHKRRGITYPVTKSSETAPDIHHHNLTPKHKKFCTATEPLHLKIRPAQLLSVHEPTRRF